MDHNVFTDSEAASVAELSAELSEGGHPAGSVVAFQVAGQRYGLPVEQVVQIVEMVAITPLPSAPPFIVGVVDFRGRVIPMLDMRRRLQLPEQAYTLRTPFLVVQRDSKMVGLVVDGVSGVVEIEPGQIQPAAEVVPAAGLERIRYLAGVARLEEGLLLLLDLEALLAVEFDYEPLVQVLEETAAYYRVAFRSLACLDGPEEEDKAHDLALLFVVLDWNKSISEEPIVEVLKTPRFQGLVEGKTRRARVQLWSPDPDVAWERIDSSAKQLILVQLVEGAVAQAAEELVGWLQPFLAGYVQQYLETHPALEKGDERVRGNLRRAIKGWLERFIVGEVNLPDDEDILDALAAVGLPAEPGAQTLPWHDAQREVPSSPRQVVIRDEDLEAALEGETVRREYTLEGRAGSYEARFTLEGQRGR